MSRRPRNSVNDRPSRWKLFLRRQKRLLRPAAWAAVGVLVLLLGVMVWSAAPGSTILALRERLGTATGSVGLRVTRIVIEGRANTPEPLLHAALGIRLGDPILGFSLEQARQRVESLGWVEQATVERRLPNTVVVVLMERRPFAVWQNKGKMTVIDRAGLVLENQDPSQFRHLPLVVGAGAETSAAELLDAMRDRLELTKRTVAAVRVGERRWNLHLKNGADVLLPEGHEIAALDRLMKLHETQALLDRPLSRIDLRLPDRLVLRPRAEQKGDAAAGPAGAPRVPASSKKPI